MDNSIKPFNPVVRPLHNSKHEDVQAKVREVSGLYEKQFLREMVKAMRQTVGTGGLIPENMGQKIFREQLDNEYVEAWGDKGGIGLADMIYERLMQQVSGGSAQAVHGPIPLDRVQTIQLRQNQGGQGGGARLRVKPTVVLPGGSKSDGAGTSQQGSRAPLSGAAPVKSPFAGVVTGWNQGPNDLKSLELSHPKEGHSLIHFDGALIGCKIGDKVMSGQTLGWVLPETWLQWDYES